MPYGVISRVPQPIEAYDQTVAAIGPNANPPGLILHVARATDTGFEIVEVWDSKADFDRFNEQVIGPILQSQGVDLSVPGLPPIEFDASRVIIPHRH